MLGGHGLSADSQGVIKPVDLYAFGPRSGPRGLRVGVDIHPDEAGMIGPESLPFPAGASTLGAPQMAPLTGHFHRLPKGTPLPDGFGTAADGVDVQPHSNHEA